MRMKLSIILQLTISFLRLISLLGSKKLFTYWIQGIDLYQSLESSYEEYFVIDHLIIDHHSHDV